MRHGELHWRRLVRLDVHVLPARRGGVDRKETDAAVGVAVLLGAGDDQGLGVLLVLDLAEVGAVVGVGEFEGLEFADVKEAFEADAEAEVGVCGLALGGFEGDCGGSAEKEGGCDGWEDKHDGRNIVLMGLVSGEVLRMFWVLF